VTTMKAEPASAHIAKEFEHDRPWIACRFEPSGKFVIGASEDFQVWRVDLESGAKTPFPTESWVRAVAVVEGTQLLTGGYDGRLIWWPLLDEKPQAIRSVQAHHGFIRAITVSPDGRLLATCGNDGLVKLWQVGDGSLVRQFSGLQRHVYNVRIHPQGNDIVAGDLTARFMHWELTSGKTVREFQLATLHKYDTTFLADYGGPFSMDFSADGTRLACGGITNVTNAFAGVGNPAVSIVNWESATEECVHLSKASVQGTARGLILHPQGFAIAATGGPGGGHLFFWQPGEKEEFHSLNLGNVARDLSLHADGLRLATAHHDRKLRITLLAAKS
jgi:WD40 repeat protein